MSDPNLITDSPGLLAALKKRFSDLNDVELEQVALAILSEVGKRLVNGEQIAFVKKTTDDRTTLTILKLEVMQQMKLESEHSKSYNP